VGEGLEKDGGRVGAGWGKGWGNKWGILYIGLLVTLNCSHYFAATPLG
jgi:hypothetical protein